MCGHPRLGRGQGIRPRVVDEQAAVRSGAQAPRREGTPGREQALVFGELLFADTPDTFAGAQIAATLERLDTEHLRRAELHLLARGAG